VDRPHEGTVLTVLDDAASAAAKASGRGDDAAGVLSAALTAARTSLARTVDELPELKEAGVVDAGGKGAVLLLDALYAEVAGEESTEPPGPRGPVGVVARSGAAPAPALEFAWEVQALLEASPTKLPALRSSLAELGGSLAVVGGDGLFNVHVHTDRPDDAVGRIRAAGTPVEVSVLSLADQVSACGVGAGLGRGVQAGLPSSAMVAVAAGPGLADAFRSLGAIVVSAGGGDPTLAELRDAVRAAPGRSILLLPNNDGLVHLATEACADAARPATVVPAASVPAGLAAATAFHPDASLETNASVMRGAADRCHVASSPSDPRAVVIVAEGLRRQVPEAQLLTLVAGDAVAEEEVEAALALLRTRLPDLEVQFVAGGQPGPDFVLGME
jgi:dihydroxyacetone kinase-like predicted kinase